MEADWIAKEAAEKTDWTRRWMDDLLVGAAAESAQRRGEHARSENGEEYRSECSPSYSHDERR